jgi:flavodoxin I
MAKVGIIFGTETGYTRKTAKLMAKQLGKELVPDKPVNINRISVEEFLAFDKLILGTPTYGEGVLPGMDTGIEAGSWADFLPQLADDALQGKMIALYGFGDQKKYSDRFVNAMGLLHDALVEKGAQVIGHWPTDSYEFQQSLAERDGSFVGLALDDKNQGMLTSERVERWLEQIKPALLD